MTYEVVMPQLGLTMEEGTVVSWQKQPGDWVEKGEILFTLETDKAAMEVESSDSGYLNSILVEVGKTIPVGTVIATLGDRPDEAARERKSDAAGLSETAISASKPVAEPISNFPESGSGADRETPATGSREIAISPRARRLADELGIDINSIEPARGRRVVEDDIRRFAENKKATSGTAKAEQDSGTAGRISATKKIVAQRMTESFQKAPHFYLGVEANATELLGFREELRKNSDQPGAKNLTYTDIFLRALAMALKEHPHVNAYWETEAIQLRDSIDVGFAVEAPVGLVVPVIRKADQLDFFAFARQRTALTEKARAAKLIPQELEGGSATLSNLGSYGVDWFQAILNPPQSIILATGQITKRALVVSDTLCVCPTVILSLSVDHRVLDGVAASKFLGRIKNLIENPHALLS